MDRRVSEGSPFPRGATWDGKGVNFSLFSAHATRVEVRLFDAAGERELKRIELPENTNEIWHGYVTGIGPSTVYGYRVYGRTSRRRGTAPTRTSCCSIRTRAPIPAS